MTTLEEIDKNGGGIFIQKGCLCVGTQEAATRKKCCGKKKLPAERGGRSDNNTLLKNKL